MGYHSKIYGMIFTHSCYNKTNMALHNLYFVIEKEKIVYLELLRKEHLSKAIALNKYFNLN